MDMEGPSPVTSLTAEDFSQSGATDLINLFSKLPISGQGTFSTQANSSDDTANGGSSISLRGLGADSTLILINGRRVAVSPFAKGISTAFVDINNIPLAAIKRIDILKDGASATYGADAIAGVINIILKDDYEGMQLSGKLADTSSDGGQEKNLSVVWGNSSDKAQHTFIIDYFEREEILYGDRDFAKSANQAALHPNDPWATDFRSSSGYPGTIALAANPSTRLPDTFGQDVCPSDSIKGDLCRYDYAPYMSLVPASKRFSFNYLGKYEISANIQAFIELNGQSAKTVVKGAGSPSFNELFMAGDNANHPFINMPSHDFYQQDLTMRRRMVEIGNRKKVVDSDYYRTVLGLTGQFGDWDWETAISHISNKSIERGVDGFPNARRAQNAIDDGSWNPFEPSQNSQAALDYIETTTSRFGKSASRIIDAKISGPIFSLPAGEVMIAIGAEHRKESISDNPDDQFLRGEIFGTEATQANGQRDNTALYTELAIPVIENLELQLALRHENYSDFGTTTNPKIAFLWSANEDISLRGSWGSAFRAPSLAQLGLGASNESPNLVDTLRCEAVGNINRACEPQEYTTIFSGNSELTEETSKSYNLGVIYNITEHLNLSLDYYHYDIEEIIDSDTQFMFSHYGHDSNVVTRLPSSLPNDPGEVINIYDTFQNIGDLITSGIDLDSEYLLETNAGTFTFSYVLNYMLKYEDKRPDGNGGTRINIQEGGFEQPKVRWTAGVDWQTNDFNSYLGFNYIGEFAQKVAVYQDGMSNIDAMLTVDMSVSYLGLEQTIVKFGATNLFNEEPPFSYHDFMGYVTNVHNGIGRYIYLEAIYSF